MLDAEQNEIRMAQRRCADARLVAQSGCCLRILGLASGFRLSGLF